jgi:CRP-like cAMP-binding protein
MFSDWLPPQPTIRQSQSGSIEPDSRVQFGSTATCSREIQRNHSRSRFKALNLPVQVSTHVIRLRRDAEIYGANEPAEYVYEVISGVVRSYKVLEGGQRQIVNFYSTGDIFGLEFGGVYSLATEAVEDCAVLVVNQHSLISAASPASSIARQLWLLTAVEVDRARQHMLFLIKTAEERLAAFLLLMAKSSRSGLEVDLAMFATGHRRLPWAYDRDRLKDNDAVL